MTNAATLNVALTAQVSDLSKKLGRMDKRIKMFAKNGKRSMNTLKVAFAGFVSVSAVRRITSGLGSIAENLDRTAKTASKLSVATENLTALHHAATLTGVSSRNLDTGLQRMTRRVSEAAAGTGEAVKSLKELGLTAKTLNQLSPDKQFERIAEAMSKVNNEQDQLRLAVKIFDTEGAGLVNTFKGGAEGLRQMTEQAKALGFAFEKADLAQVEAMNDSLGTAVSIISAIGKKIVIEIAPFVKVIADEFIKWASEGSNMSDTFDMISTTVKTIASWSLKIFKVYRLLSVILSGSVLTSVSNILEGVDAIYISAVKLVNVFGKLPELLSSAGKMISSVFSIAFDQVKVSFANLMVNITQGMITTLRSMGPLLVETFGQDAFSGMLGAVTQARTSFAALGMQIRNDKTAVTEFSEELKKVQGIMSADTKVAGLFGNLPAQLRSAGAELMSQVPELTKEWLNAGSVVDGFVQSVENAKLKQSELVAQAKEGGPFQIMGRMARETWETFGEWFTPFQESLTRTVTENMQEQARFTMQSMNSVANGFSSIFKNMQIVAEKSGKKRRSLASLAAKGEIIASTASAAMNSYNAMAGIPYVGPVLGAAAAAAAVAAGAVQLSQAGKAASGHGGVTTAGLGGAASSASGSAAAAATPARERQAVFIEGGASATITAEQFAEVTQEAREQGYDIDVRFDER